MFRMCSLHVLYLRFSSFFSSKVTSKRTSFRDAQLWKIHSKLLKTANLNRSKVLLLCGLYISPVAFLVAMPLGYYVIYFSVFILTGVCVLNLLDILCNASVIQRQVFQCIFLLLFTFCSRFYPRVSLTIQANVILISTHSRLNWIGGVISRTSDGPIKYRSDIFSLVQDTGGMYFKYG